MNIMNLPMPKTGLNLIAPSRVADFIYYAGKSGYTVAAVFPMEMCPTTKKVGSLAGTKEIEVIEVTAVGVSLIR